MKRSAVLAFDDKCRLELLRVWDPELPRAAWLLTNPSTADHEVDDLTSLRVVHHSRRLGAGSAILVNIMPWRSTDPADMLRALDRGDISADMIAANLSSVMAAGAQSQIHLVAFGVLHRSLGYFRSRAIERFRHHAEQLLCLGTSPAGWPLHPLARGKFAVRNDAEILPWTPPR